jgi:hypothetical protein
MVRGGYKCNFIIKVTMCSKEIAISCAQKLLTFLDSIMNMILFYFVEGGWWCYDYLMSTRIFTLIMIRQ